jgi:hypothetical protein
MSEQGKSYLIPIMAGAVLAGLARLVLRKRKEDKAAEQAKRAARERAHPRNL